MESENKRVLITGANRGIGLSFCQYYKALGYIVYGVCRKSSPALEKAAEIVIDGVDIGNAKDCHRLFGRLSDTKLDLLINNAGILRNEVLGQIDFDSVETQFQINATGALRVTEGLLSSLKEGSKVAIITSRMGSVSDNDSGGRYGYRMSKAALNAAGKSLAIDLKPKGICVAILHPGLVGTEMIGGSGDITPDQAAERLAARIDELNMSNTGTFWHSNGEVLPW
jgi:NAD(P)-dependent dehydrogenase (short-subunit alcohol dehydrogenase family)